MNETVQKLLSVGRGILAADESAGTITKRFASIGLVSSPELNKKYREVLFTTPDIEKYISGVILYDETIRQGLQRILLDKGIVPGIKVDEGLENYNGTPEQITKDVNNLEEKLKEYYELGARFTKWRAVFKITDIFPSKSFLEGNLTRMTKYALAAQKCGFVPIVEPEVLLDGNHTTTRCELVVTDVLKNLFDKLKSSGVDLTNLILKSSMVLPGKDSGVVAEPLEVANATLRALRNSVPKEVPGIVFLSGGQTSWDAIENLDKIEDLAGNDPWQITFSYSRALQEEPMHVWLGKEENIDAAQTVFLGKLKEVCLARKGSL
jgi:fructose-bisphosphate aldolase, class I